MAESMTQREPDWDLIPLRRIPVQARSRQKVTNALEAAERIARRDGVEALSLTSVADEAGLSVGALYQYLPDRDAIAQALAARYHARLESLFDEAIDSVARAGAPADPVGAVLAAVAEVYRDESTARGLRRVAPPDAATRAHKRRMADKIGMLLRATGAVAEEARTDAVARVVFTAADAVLHDAFAEEDPMRARLLAELERMLRGLIGDA